MAQSAEDSDAASTRPRAAADDNPVDVRNPGAASRYLLVGDHAGRHIPDRLNDLGLSQVDLARHIASDLGVRRLGLALSTRLGVTFISQRISRLVIDCNRHPDHPASIVVESDGTCIPGNAALDGSERARRRREIFDPYHATIAAVLDGGPANVLVALHSFTPMMKGRARPWRIGVLHRNDSPLSLQVLRRLRARLGEGVVGDNEPYAMDGTDFTAPYHCDPRGLDYLELEVRQDELSTAEGCAVIAGLIVEALQ